MTPDLIRALAHSSDASPALANYILDKLEELEMRMDDQDARRRREYDEREAAAQRRRDRYAAKSGMYR